MQPLLFLLFFAMLFLLSRRFTRLLSHLLLRIFKNHGVAIYILSFLFLPGVILHELSHFLIASMLFVPTGEIEFLPEIQGNEVKMGSVAIARTDPLRRFLIGVAPVVGGLGAMLLLASFLTDILSWQGILLGYAIFEIANTMFASRKDMEGALGFAVALGLLAVALSLLGMPVLSFGLTFFQTQGITNFFLRLNVFLSIAMGIDIFLVLLLEGAVGISGTKKS